MTAYNKMLIFNIICISVILSEQSNLNINNDSYNIYKNELIGIIELGLSILVRNFLNF